MNTQTHTPFYVNGKLANVTNQCSRFNLKIWLRCMVNKRIKFQFSSSYRFPIKNQLNCITTKFKSNCSNFFFNKNISSELVMLLSKVDSMTHTTLQYIFSPHAMTTEWVLKLKTVKKVGKYITFKLNQETWSEDRERVRKAEP